MVRTVAVVGVLLAVLGVVAETLAFRYVFSGQAYDLWGSWGRNLFGLGQITISLCVTVGVVLLAVALVMAFTGRAPGWGTSPAALWSGVGLIVAAVLLEVAVTRVLLPGLNGTGQETLFLAAQSFWGVVRMVGSVLIGLSLAGLLTATAPRARRAPAQAPLGPSRPF
ncbi:hypothetical protein [Ornithinimicrobium cavernae]|uniref:hypothetical protein n=1 Tax=Ornithinimicrobium cavernae TaxID=2666047 RepID=UPI0012B185C0|nr:hypothetical protein [Ornithinimicrobium cavernae]